MNAPRTIPTVSATYARNGASIKANTLGMRPMQERAYAKRGEQYLLIKSPPASGKSRAIRFDGLLKVLEPYGKAVGHIPKLNSREAAQNESASS